MLEPLEFRALLSVVILPGGKSATYHDVDGDNVTVAVSVGTLLTGNFTTVASGSGEQLQVMDMPLPQPGPADALVKLDYAGINFIDVYMRSGNCCGWARAT